MPLEPVGILSNRAGQHTSIPPGATSTDGEIPPGEDQWLQRDASSKNPAEAVYCETCEIWPNGGTQWEDHKICKKHRKALRRIAVTSVPVVI